MHSGSLLYGTNFGVRLPSINFGSAKLCDLEHIFQISLCLSFLIYKSVPQKAKGCQIHKSLSFFPSVSAIWGRGKRCPIAPSLCLDFLVVILIRRYCSVFWAASNSSQSVQLLSHVWLFATPWTAARQTSLSITSSQSPLKLVIMSVMPSNHRILCCPLLLPPSIFPTMRVFSSESVLRIRWPKYWSFNSASVLPMNI